VFNEHLELKDKTLKLHIELVPSTVWESSLYRLMPREVWNRKGSSQVERRVHKKREERELVIKMERPFDSGTWLMALASTEHGSHVYSVFPKYEVLRQLNKPSLVFTMLKNRKPKTNP
jgi:hypothetical protein